MKANFMRIAHKHTNALAFDECLILWIREFMGGKKKTPYLLSSLMNATGKRLAESHLYTFECL